MCVCLWWMGARRPACLELAQALGLVGQAVAVLPPVRVVLVGCDAACLHNVRNGCGRGVQGAAGVESEEGGEGAKSREQQAP